jgi:hypothetical protein
MFLPVRGFREGSRENNIFSVWTEVKNNIRNSVNISHYTYEAIREFYISKYIKVFLCTLFYAFFLQRNLTSLFIYAFCFRFNTIWLVYLYFYLFFVIRRLILVYNFLFTSTFTETQLGHKARMSRIFVFRFIQHNDICKHVLRRQW